MLALSKVKNKRGLSVIYTAVQMGKLALLDFKLLCSLNVWRNTDCTHAVLAAVLALPKSRSQREQPKAQLPEGTAASPALQLCVQGGGRPEEEEQRMLQQSGSTESELSLLSGKASAWAQVATVQGQKPAPRIKVS